MLKVHCHVSKKIPIPSKDYSSQSFACGVEAELADAADANALKAKAEELFALVQRAVEDEIAKATGHGGANAGTGPLPANQGGLRRANGAGFRRGSNGNGNGHGRRRPTGATQAQQRALYAITQDLGLNLADVLADYNVGDARDLTVADASRLIDDLKAQQNVPAPRR